MKIKNAISELKTDIITNLKLVYKINYCLFVFITKLFSNNSL